MSDKKWLTCEFFFRNSQHLIDIDFRQRRCSDNPDSKFLLNLGFSKVWTTLGGADQPPPVWSSIELGGENVRVWWQSIKITSAKRANKYLAKLEEIVSRLRRILRSVTDMVLLAERVARQCRPQTKPWCRPDWPLLGPAPTLVRYRGATTGFQTQTQTSKVWLRMAWELPWCKYSSSTNQKRGDDC